MKWSDEQRALLGTDTDAVIAARIGISENAVRHRRRDLGISAHTPHQREWSKRDLSQLGKIPDSQLAAQLGVTRLTVLKKRRALGIAPASPVNTPKKFRRRRAAKTRI